MPNKLSRPEFRGFGAKARVQEAKRKEAEIRQQAETKRDGNRARAFFVSYQTRLVEQFTPEQWKDDKFVRQTYINFCFADHPNTVDLKELT